MKNRFCLQGQFLNFRKKICEKILYFPILFPESLQLLAGVERSRSGAEAKSRPRDWG